MYFKESIASDIVMARIVVYLGYQPQKGVLL